MIHIEALSKIYDMGDIEVKALNNISLDIGRHEFVAIIGASGSGKSTLMNIIGCLDTATSGTYELNQKDINSYSQTRLAEIRNEEIGFIFQGFNLLHKLDALHNTELPLIYKGVGYKKRMELSKKALADVGLGDRLHHRPNQLSGGQQQRVAIARALVTDPSIILADEPTGNLDSRSGTEVLNILTALHKKGAAILLITHEKEIAAVAERQIVLKDGQIISDTGVAG